MAAVAFEIFKLVGSIYLRSVVHGPAGATFGPVLGLMVFAYITARLVLFATAWAATSEDNMRPEPVPAPAPAVITPRVRPGRGSERTADGGRGRRWVRLARLVFRGWRRSR